MPNSPPAVSAHGRILGVLGSGSERSELGSLCSCGAPCGALSSESPGHWGGVRRGEEWGGARWTTRLTRLAEILPAFKTEESLNIRDLCPFMYPLTEKIQLNKGVRIKPLFLVS